MNASNTDSVPVKPDSAQLLLVELNSMFPHDAWLKKKGEPDDDASMNFEELLGIPAKELHASTVHVSKGDWSEDTFKTMGNLSNSCPLLGSTEFLDGTDTDKGKKENRKCKRKSSGRARSKEKSAINRRVCFSSEPPQDRNIPTPQPVAPDQGSGSGFTVISVGPPLRQRQIQSPQSSFSAFSPAHSDSSQKQSPPKFSRRRKTKSLVVIPSETGEFKTTSLRQSGISVQSPGQGRTNSLILVPSKSDEICRTAHLTSKDAPPKFGRRGRTHSLIVLPTKREEMGATSHSTPMDSPPRFARRGRANSLVIVPTKKEEENASEPMRSPVKAIRRRRVNSNVLTPSESEGITKVTPPSTPTSSPVKFSRKRRTTSLTVQPTESGEFKAMAYPSPTKRESVGTSLSPTQVRRKRSTKRDKARTSSQDRSRRSSKSSNDNMDVPVLPGSGSVVDYDITRSPSGHLGPGPEISTPVGNSRKSVSSPGKHRSLSPARSVTPSTALEMSMSNTKRAQLRSKILSPPLDSGSVPAFSDTSHRRSRVGNDNDALPTPSRSGPTGTPRGSRRKYVVSPHMPSPKNSSEYNAYLRSKSARYIARCGLLALPLDTEDATTEATTTTSTPTPRRAQSLVSEYTRSTTSTATTAKTISTDGSHSTSPGGVPDGHVGSSGTVRRRSGMPSAPLTPSMTPRSERKAYLHTLDLVGQWKEEYRKNKPESPGGPPLTSDDFEEFQPKTPPKRVDSDSATQDDSLADAVETKEARLRQYFTKTSHNDRHQRDSYWVEAFKRNFFKRKSSHGRSNRIQPEVVF